MSVTLYRKFPFIGGPLDGDELSLASHIRKVAIPKAAIAPLLRNDKKPHAYEIADGDDVHVYLRRPLYSSVPGTLAFEYVYIGLVPHSADFHCVG